MEGQDSERERGLSSGRKERKARKYGRQRKAGADKGERARTPLEETPQAETKPSSLGWGSFVAPENTREAGGKPVTGPGRPLSPRVGLGDPLPPPEAFPKTPASPRRREKHREEVQEKGRRTLEEPECRRGEGLKPRARVKTRGRGRGRPGAAGRGRFMAPPGFQGLAAIAAAARVRSCCGRCAPCAGSLPRPGPCLPLLTSV